MFRSFSKCIEKLLPATGTACDWEQSVAYHSPWGPMYQKHTTAETTVICLDTINTITLLLLTAGTFSSVGINTEIVPSP